MLYVVVVNGNVIHVGDNRQEAMDAGEDAAKGKKGATFTLVTMRDSSCEEIRHPLKEEMPAAVKGKGK